MAKKHRIALLHYKACMKRGRYEPNLWLEIKRASYKPLRLTRFPQEIKDAIFEFVFNDWRLADDTKPTKKLYTANEFSTSVADRREGMRLGNSGDDDTESKLRAAGSRMPKKQDASIPTIDGTKPIVLYGITVDSVPFIEQYIFDKLTIELRCGDILYPRDAEIMSHARRLTIRFNEGPLIFSKHVLPILKERDNLKYLHIRFTTWPGDIKGWVGKLGAQLLQRKLQFMTEIKTESAKLEVSRVDENWLKVIKWLADVMMGDEEAEKTDPTDGMVTVERKQPNWGKLKRKKKTVNRFERSFRVGGNFGSF